MSLPGYKDPNKVRVNAYVPRPMHKQLKNRAIEAETTVDALVLYGITLAVKAPVSELKLVRDRRLK